MSRTTPAVPLASIPALFSALAGIWVAVTLVKFGNPVILDAKIHTPETASELLYFPWPIRWGYIGITILLLASIPFFRRSEFNKERAGGGRLKWFLALPLLWFAWQVLSASQTVRPDLTAPTLLHFAACTVAFYIGCFVLGRAHNLTPFWLGVLAGVLIVFSVGFNQHFGGLERTRRAFEQMQADPSQAALVQKLDSPEFRKKLQSDRIFSTFVYPNTLAGAILLFLPPTLLVLWQMSRRASGFLRKLLVGLWACIGLACLYWSGSKAGWLICLVIAAFGFLHLPISKKIKTAITIGIIAIGIAGFAAKYSGYFASGATSATARTDYWRAAFKLSMEKPLLGSGPGTFLEGYARLKSAESEMARLAHNDYLQQACDSGWPGCYLYFCFVWGCIYVLYRIWRAQDKTEQPLLFALWLGVTGFAFQGFVEFSLYIPALAWPFFLFLGLLWRKTVPN
jgi:O-antigen ligase